MNLGRNLEEVIALIRKHEAFEKSAQAQDERFQALQKLTNYELKEMQRREMDAEEERRRRAGSPPQGRRGETTFPAEGGVRTAPEGTFSPFTSVRRYVVQCSLYASGAVVLFPWFPPYLLLFVTVE